MCSAQMDCFFCNLDLSRIIDSNDHCVVISDGYPISPGHTLVIPKRHVSSFFDLSIEERQAIMILIESAKRMLDTFYQPDAYNIGINDGPAAGQTVPHVHIHLIPRYVGDCDDPRGGIRWIKPDKAKYWTD
jgi:diadenosine tetraphosphate (Ap4A) HIT family hydrolase